MTEVRIALVGDYDPLVTAHRTIPEALEFAARRIGVDVLPEWIHTSVIGPAAEGVAGYAGVWCVPASPYASEGGALAAIGLARHCRRPFLGTCGGFQHAILEYVRNVLGAREAAHAETAPDSDMPVIARLACSLVEKSGRVFLAERSRLRSIYGSASAEEAYHCNYGFNPAFERLLADPDGLRVAARDAEGDVRAVELVGHPFFVATLYQPERSALRGVAHPLVTAFVAAASGRPVEPGTAATGGDR